MSKYNKKKLSSLEHYEPGKCHDKNLNYDYTFCLICTTNINKPFTFCLYIYRSIILSSCSTYISIEICTYMTRRFIEEKSGLFE